MTDRNDVSVERMVAAQELAITSISVNWESRRPAFEAARDYILAAHAILGPKCPKCGHWLKAEHKHQGQRRAVARFICTHDIDDPTAYCDCSIADTELLSDYPEIAKEMGLS